MATHDSIRPTRRALLATLPAVPVMALPALADQDDQLDALLRCAVETGLSLDLLDAATRGLSRTDRDRVLSQLATLSERFKVVVYHRQCDPMHRLKHVFEEIGEAMQPLAAKHGANTWQLHAGESQRRGGVTGDVMVAVDRTGPPDESGTAWIKMDVKERYWYLGDVVEPDRMWKRETGAA